MFETVVTLKPRAEWTKGEDWDGLVKKLDEALQFSPGLVPKGFANASNANTIWT